MSGVPSLFMFLPPWAAPWVVTIAIGAWIVGARRLATVLGVLLVVDALAAPLIEPWLATVPLWALAAGGLVLGLLVVHDLVSLVFGRGVADHFVGQWLLRLADYLILGPFRGIRWLLRLLSG